MLTPEQIQEFERRAAAGENPVHPGWEWNPINRPFFNCDGTWELCNMHVYPSTQKRTNKPTVFYLADGPLVREWDEFTSLPAAQLAAEHLLMDATAPLWAETVKALTEAAAALREMRTALETISDRRECLGRLTNIAWDTDLAGIESAAKKASKA